MIKMTGEFRKVSKKMGGGYVVSLRSNAKLNDPDLQARPGTKAHQEQVGIFIERPLYVSLCHAVNGHVLPTIAQSLARFFCGVTGRDVPKSLQYEEPPQNRRWDVMSQDEVAERLVAVNAPGNTRALQVHVPNMTTPPKGYKQAPASHFPGHAVLFKK